MIELVELAVVACPATVTFRCETMFASERLTAVKIYYFLLHQLRIL